MKRNAVHRNGSTAVEFAVVAIPMFLFIVGSIEIGRAMMSIQAMEEGARAACRAAIIKGASTTSIEAAADEVLGPAGISSYSVEVTPNFETLNRWEHVSVTVTAGIDAITWLPVPKYLVDKTFIASCVMPKECAPGS